MNYYEKEISILGEKNKESMNEYKIKIGIQKEKYEKIISKKEEEFLQKLMKTNEDLKGLNKCYDKMKKKNTELSVENKKIKSINEKMEENIKNFETYKKSIKEEINFLTISNEKKIEELKKTYSNNRKSIKIKLDMNDLKKENSNNDSNHSVKIKKIKCF